MTCKALFSPNPRRDCSERYYQMSLKNQGLQKSPHDSVLDGFIQTKINFALVIHARKVISFLAQMSKEKSITKTCQMIMIFLILRVLMKVIMRVMMKIKIKRSFMRLHSISPLPFSARGTSFSPKFWKGGNQRINECLRGYKDFLPWIFAWRGLPC